MMLHGQLFNNIYLEQQQIDKTNRQNLKGIIKNGLLLTCKHTSIKKKHLYLMHSRFLGSLISLNGPTLKWVSLVTRRIQSLRTALVLTVLDIEENRTKQFQAKDVLIGKKIIETNSINQEIHMA